MNTSCWYSKTKCVNWNKEQRNGNVFCFPYVIYAYNHDAKRKSKRKTKNAGYKINVMYTFTQLSYTRVMDWWESSFLVIKLSIQTKWKKNNKLGNGMNISYTDNVRNEGLCRRLCSIIFGGVSGKANNKVCVFFSGFCASENENLPITGSER